jgi:hypothetical protein
MGLRPLLLRPVRGAPRKSFIYCNYGCYNVKPDGDLCIATRQSPILADERGDYGTTFTGEALL